MTTDVEHPVIHVERSVTVEAGTAQSTVSVSSTSIFPLSGSVVRVPLSRLCLARSGDKGDTANIGVIAWSPALYSWMLDNLTSKYVWDRFADICLGEVERHEVSNLLACNYLLSKSLGGGGTSSLLMDAQGKTYAEYLLEAEVEVDEALVATGYVD